MRITFTVTVDADHVSGKFVSRADLAQEIIGDIESADPGSVTVEDSEYEISEWSVEDDT